MTEDAAWPHVPVLADQVAEFLERPETGWILDGTLGAGGHASMLLERLPEARLFGVDRDPSALALARERLAPFGERATLAHCAYADAAEKAQELGLGPFDAILLDLGFSSMQVDRAERGFAFSQDGPLDMRMDPTQPLTAEEVVRSYPEEELANVIYRLGEERFSRRIARAIVEARVAAPIRTTSELAELVRRVVPRGRPPRGKGRGKRPGRRGRPRSIDPATRTFQALRLEVNDELGQLERGLVSLFESLAPGGRLAVISFHSLEDRPVKWGFRALKDEGRGVILTKKPRIASDEEVVGNARARSAKLRVIERVAATR